MAARYKKVTTSCYPDQPVTRHLAMAFHRHLLPLLGAVAALATFCAAGPHTQSGAYVVQLRYIDPCKEGRSLVDFNLDVEDEEGSDRGVITGTFTVHERLEDITGSINSSFRTAVGWRSTLLYRIRDWCREGVIRRILAATNLTLDNCAIPPGTYAVTGLDMDEPVHAAVGDSAPLGLYRTRLDLQAGGAPAACATAEVEVVSRE